MFLYASMHVHVGSCMYAWGVYVCACVSVCVCECMCVTSTVTHSSGVTRDGSLERTILTIDSKPLMAASRTLNQTTATNYAM